MTKQARQVWWLVGLLAVLAGVLTYEWWPAGTATNGSAPSNPKTAAAVAASMQVADVDLERLQGGVDVLSAPKRDPFRFRPKPAPPPPPPPPLPPVAIARPPQPPADPRPEIQVKYVGFVMSPSGTRLAMLQDGAGRSPVFGKQGDVIEGKYRLLRVEPGEVEMSYLDGARRRRIVKGQ